MFCFYLPQESRAAHCFNCKFFLIIFRRKNPAPLILRLPPLRIDDRRRIVREKILSAQKQISLDQTDLLVNKLDGVKPLYLLLACEELLESREGRRNRLFSDNKDVERLIRKLPESLAAVYDVALDRLVS